MEKILSDSGVFSTGRTRKGRREVKNSLIILLG